MRSEWKTYKLQELCNIKYGKDHKALEDGTIPVYGSGGIMRYATKAIYTSPSVLIPRKGTLSNLFYIDEPFWTVDTLFYTEIFEEKIFPRYLFYLLKSINLEDMNVGTAVPSLTTAVLNEISLELPESIKKQRAIAATLSCLDDKIELNNKINANLEAQAQAIFKSWFVDFDPFQDGEFADSELGMIPKGWRVGTLADIAHYVKERILIENCNIENYISTENMLANRQGVANASSLPTASGVSRYTNNDVLISNIRPYFKKIWFADQVGGCSNDVLVIRAINEIINGLLYSLLYSDGFFEYMTATSKGTKMPRGDKSAIMRYSIALPEVFENDIHIKQFNQIVLQIQKKIQLIRKENQSLSALRDALLPKLMSGEIEVPVAEALIQERS